MRLSRGYAGRAAALFVSLEATDYKSAGSPEIVPAIRDVILNLADAAEAAGMVEVALPFDTLRMLLGVRVEDPRG